MALPTTIHTLKIHPAIGIARLGGSKDFFVFGDMPQTYKASDGVKRQAVQFVLVGYDAQGNEVEELTPEKLAKDYGLQVVWNIHLANDKLASRRNRDDPKYRIEARSTTHPDDPSHGMLIGKMSDSVSDADFEQRINIPLGQISSGGLFLPPQSKVFKAKADDPYADHVGMFWEDGSDNTSDGMVSADLYELTEDGLGSKVDKDILPAWVIVAPPDFAPDWTDDDAEVWPDDQPKDTLARWLLDRLRPQAPQPLNRTAFEHEILHHCTSDFTPGIEMNINRLLPLASHFYSAAETSNEAELRLRPKDAQGGVEPGNLTYALCSPWQFDFDECVCGYWAAHRPDVIFRKKADGSLVEVNWNRKKVADDVNTIGSERVDDNSEYVDHVDELGIIRKIDGKPIETEREDDIL